MFIFHNNFQFQQRQLALEGKYVLLYQRGLMGTMMMKLCVPKYVCVCVWSECEPVLTCAMLNVCVFPGGVVSV